MSKWVALLDHPCSCREASRSGVGGNGSKLTPQGVTPPHHGLAGCLCQQHVAQSSWLHPRPGETSVTHRMFFPFIPRGAVLCIPSNLSEAMRNHVFPRQILVLL